MSRKRNIVCLLFVMLLTMSSCSWLDVSPSNEVNEEDMFSKGDGYRNALNGLYLKLSESSFYGRNLSWGFIEVLGQQYLTDFMERTSTYYKAAGYKYDDADVKSVISGFWSTAYNGIASCNHLIYKVSEADLSVFQEREMERNMIWGEALALRALFHFDIMRLFAPSMETDDGKKYIPYVDSYPVISTTYYTNTEILKKIESDLLQARDLVAKCDIEEHPEWMETSYRMFARGMSSELPEEVFFAYRGYRMNYYAITALLARVYLWEKEYKKAFDCAEAVVKATHNDRLLFGFVGSSELGGDVKDSESLIFTVSNETLTDDFKPFITSDSKTRFLFSGSSIFEGSQEDQRGSSSMVGNQESVQYSKKYTLAEGTYGYDMIPVIRLSEMYYIMAEYYARNANFIESGKMLDAVRSARGIISNTSNIISLDDFISKLLKEIRKELIGEGQLYFQYKRLNNNSFADGVKFVFDRPENEEI